MEAYRRSPLFLQLQPRLQCLPQCLHHQLLQPRSQLPLEILGVTCANLVLNATVLALRTRTAKSNNPSLFSIKDHFLLMRIIFFADISNASPIPVATTAG